ncbi:MAG: pseudouridine synthase [Candidatus Cryptobacteroides sp.]
MEDNRRGGYGRRTEGRREYGRNDSDRRPSDRRDFAGERKSFGGNGERRSFGDRPRSFGQKKNYGDRPVYSTSGEKRSYGDRPSRNFGEKKSYGDRPSFGSNDQRRSYGDRPSRSFGERKSYGDRPSFGDNSERRQSDRPRRPFAEGGERRQPSGRNFSSDRRRPSSERRPAGRPGKGGFGARKNRYTDLNYFRNEDESGISRMINRRPQVDSNSFSDNDMVMTPVKEEVRLNKFIANSGICSRREADNFILAGVVTVNGEVVTELGTKININNDDVRFNGERLKGESKVYIVMNKPKGYVTTSSDPHADKTVMDLLKKCPSRVFPVGRLDKNTTGVLMFTNDGEIAEKLTHPSYDKKKIYQVSLDNKLKQEDYEKILSGVELSDGMIAADALEYIEDDDHRKLGIEIHSGKNRIVRRIFESLGYEVKALDRVYFAGLTKKGIKRGEWRYLTEGETNLLKMGAYL